MLYPYAANWVHGIHRRQWRALDEFCQGKWKSFLYYNHTLVHPYLTLQAEVPPANPSPRIKWELMNFSMARGMARDHYPQLRGRQGVGRVPHASKMSMGDSRVPFPPPAIGDAWAPLLKHIQRIRPIDLTRRTPTHTCTAPLTCGTVKKGPPPPHQLRSFWVLLLLIIVKRVSVLCSGSSMVSKAERAANCFPFCEQRGLGLDGKVTVLCRPWIWVYSIIFHASSCFRPF